MKAIESRLIDRIQVLKSFAEAKKKIEKRVEEETCRRKLPRTKSLIEEDNVTYDSAYIQELIKKNENKFFRPAHKSIVMAEQSIKEWSKKNFEVAIKNMREALKCFEHAEIKFNLGKMYLSHGVEYVEGVAQLLEYYRSSSSYDLYSIEIKKLFSLKDRNGILTGTIRGIEGNLDFKVDKEGYLHIDEDKVFYVAEIPLPFKLPISLNLQRKDNEEIQNEDYRYQKN